MNTKMQENLRKLDEYFACALVVKEKAEVEVEVDKKIEEQERNAGLKRQQRNKGTCQRGHGRAKAHVSHGPEDKMRSKEVEAMWLEG